MKTIRKIGFLLLTGVLFACNNSTPGQNTTDSGTQLSDETINSDKEDNRTAADADTVTSPGSNARDHEQGKTATAETHITETKTGTGSDPNMQGQSDTHGRDTKAGNK
jgi:hypothetical protein